jgi:hypothetical protein
LLTVLFLVFHLCYKGQYVTNVNYILNLTDNSVLSPTTAYASVNVDVLRSGNNELYLLACVAVQSGTSTYCRSTDKLRKLLVACFAYIQP